MSEVVDFDSLVERYYRSLYRFALSLAGDENDASDLTQQAFFIWAEKGHTLKDPSKVKSWLFTTIHREFLQRQRKVKRFKHCDLDYVEEELLEEVPVPGIRVDCQSLFRALEKLDSTYKAPVALFYLEEYRYKEIAEILEIPLGTVKSRISRGIEQLQWLMLSAEKGLVEKENRE